MLYLLLKNFGSMPGSYKKMAFPPAIYVEILIILMRVTLFSLKGTIATFIYISYSCNTSLSS